MSSSEGGGEKSTEWEKSGSRFTGYPIDVALDIKPEYFDPCQEAADRSLKCLRRNGGDRGMCTDYFQAYKDCKQKWMDEMKEAKRKEGKSWFGL
ncbi:Mitochondrial copper homeostasis protein [Recurvomyces mirabilis]|uniref:Mitochondrial copper homeostasis protein n=1 Tax=Recurvomyces mirabilis TaxID=574656 RepID=A0AAE1C4B4_9PEZI|nr:Mitochondrial copper homeostasis protein [Recurvomyces mirabilis]KAK5157479.1 Mitochondrial copper homeostasis protein [Recurvomyces mirabilis]